MLHSRSDLRGKVTRTRVIILSSILVCLSLALSAVSPASARMLDLTAGQSEQGQVRPNATADSCATPGTTVLTDPSNDQLTLVTANQDIQSVSIAEPYYGAGINKVVFTLKVRNLSGLSVASAWQVKFTDPAGQTRYVEMRTALLGAISYNYGLVNSNGTLTQQGTLDAGSTFSPDGTITLIASNSKIGNPTVGQTLTSIYAQTYLLLSLNLLIGDGANYPSPSAAIAYTLIGNAACATPTPNATGTAAAAATGTAQSNAAATAAANATGTAAANLTATAAAPTNTGTVLPTFTPTATATAPPTAVPGSGDACVVPGVVVLSDPTYDQLNLVTPGQDIQSVSIAEPYYGAGVSKLVFTMKVRNLSSLSISSAWQIIFQDPASNFRYVEMRTDLLGNITYNYGVVNGNGSLTQQGTLDAGSTFSADGTITLIASNSKIGNPTVGQTLTSIYAQTYLLLNLNLLLADSANYPTPSAAIAYTLSGNEACGPTPTTTATANATGTAAANATGTAQSNAAATAAANATGTAAANATSTAAAPTNTGTVLPTFTPTATATVPATAVAGSGSACVLPGVDVLNDPSFDQLNLVTPGQDIQSVSIAEPYYGAGVNKVVFTLKVRNLSSLTISSAWQIIFQDPAGNFRYVEMRTDLLGNITYNYGVVNGNGSLTQQGTLDAGSTFSPDGTITLIASNSKIGNPTVGQSLSSIYAQTYLLLNLNLLLADSANYPNPSAAVAYTLVGNAACGPTATATNTSAATATNTTVAGTATANATGTAAANATSTAGANATNTSVAATSTAAAPTSTGTITPTATPVVGSGNACILPGVDVLNDPSFDQLNLVTPAQDIQSVSIAEPYFGADVDKVVFTLKVRDLSARTLSSVWQVIFKDPSGQFRYVEMRTDLLNAISYNYGLVNNNGTLTQQGTLDAGSTYAPDGTITLVASNSKIGNPTVGQTLTSIYAQTYLLLNLNLLLADSANYPTPSAAVAYTLVGNAACGPTATATNTVGAATGTATANATGTAGASATNTAVAATATNTAAAATATMTATAGAGTPTATPVVGSGNACILPGVDVLNDPSFDQLNLATPAQDIQSVSIAEPYFGPGVYKVVFTLKVRSLSALSPQSAWQVLYTDPVGQARYVEMRTDLLNNVTYNYGIVNANLTQTQQGSLDASSTYNADGTITLVMASSAGAVGQTLTSIHAETFFVLNLNVVVADSANYPAPNPAVAYTIKGNLACDPAALTATATASTPAATNTGVAATATRTTTPNATATRTATVGAGTPTANATGTAAAATSTAGANATSTAGANATSTTGANATNTSVAGATSTAGAHATNTAGTRATLTASAPTATITRTPLASATRTAVVIATNTAAAQATSTARVNATNTSVAGATSTAGANATSTTGANATHTAGTQATSTAGANATSTAGTQATLTASAPSAAATRTPLASATRTAIVVATGTANANATSTAAANATNTSVAGATNTAGANATSTAGANATRTAGANATGTAAANATGTAAANATGTAAANATRTASAPSTTATRTSVVPNVTQTLAAIASQTANAHATGTAGANATGTARANATGTAGANATGTARANATGTAAAAATQTAAANTTGTPNVAATQTAAANATGTAQAGATGTSTTGSATPATTLTTTPCGITFTDVATSDYFYAGVYYLTCEGAISGYSDNTFRPYNTATRAQLVKIAVLAEGIPLDNPTKPSFSDVPATFPFYQYIETAVNHLLINGYSDGTFQPYASVTRGQISKIVVVAQGWDLLDPADPTFTDTPTDSPFYKYVETAYSHGVIAGYDDGSFRWYDSATRGQLSKIIFGAIMAGK